MKKLPSKLENLIDKKDIVTVEEYFNSKSTKIIRDLLVEALNKMEDNEEANSSKRSKYELPGWAQYQADFIGYKRCLREITKLLK